MAKVKPVEFKRLMRDGFDAWKATSGPHEGIAVDFSAADNYLYGLFLRQRSLYGAIGQLLIAPGMTTEAMILVRPLFEESVLIEYVTKLPPAERSGKMLYYERQSCEDLRGALIESKRVDPENSQGIDRWITLLADRVKRIDEYAIHWSFKLRKMPTVHDMARTIGRLDEMSPYGWTHQYVHGRSMPIMNRMTVDDEGTHSHYTADTDDGDLLPLVTTWSTKCLMRSLIGMSRMLDWAIPNAVHLLLMRIKVLEDQANKEGQRSLDT